MKNRLISFIIVLGLGNLGYGADESKEPFSATTTSGSPSAKWQFDRLLSDLEETAYDPKKALDAQAIPKGIVSAFGAPILNQALVNIITFVPFKMNSGVWTVEMIRCPENFAKKNGYPLQMVFLFNVRSKEWHNNDKEIVEKYLNSVVFDYDGTFQGMTDDAAKKLLDTLASLKGKASEELPYYEFLQRVSDNYASDLIVFVKFFGNDQFFMVDRKGRGRFFSILRDEEGFHLTKSDSLSFENEKLDGAFFIDDHLGNHYFIAQHHEVVTIHQTTGQFYLTA